MRSRPILCPTDFSDTASHALSYAIELTNFYKVDLILLHVISRPVGEHYYGVAIETPDEIEESVEMFANTKLTQIQAQLQSQLDEGLKVHHIILSGRPLEQILAQSEKSKAGLIVIASHGHRGLAHMLNPNVSEKLANQAKCPVLVVK